MVGQPVRGYERTTCDDCADREVNLSRYDDERLSDCNDADKGRRQGNLLEVRRLQESWLAHRYSAANQQQRKYEGHLTGSHQTSETSARIFHRRNLKTFPRTESCRALWASSAPVRRVRSREQNRFLIERIAHRFRSDPASSKNEYPVGHRHHL